MIHTALQQRRFCDTTSFGAAFEKSLLILSEDCRYLPPSLLQDRSISNGLGRQAASAEIDQLSIYCPDGGKGVLTILS